MINQPVPYTLTPQAEEELALAAEAEADWGDEWDDMSREEQNDAWHRQADRFAAMEKTRADQARCQALEPAEGEREAGS